MNLKQYLSDLSPEEREAFASRAGTKAIYLTQLAGGHRKPSPAMALALREASDNQIELAALRPDIWSEVA